MSKKSTKTAKTSKSSKKPAKPASDRILEKFKKTGKPAAEQKDDRRGIPPHEQSGGQPVAQDGHTADLVNALTGGRTQPEEAAPVATGGDPAAKPTTTTTAPTGSDTGEPGATGGKRIGILSAAVKVLEEHDGAEPLNCQQMVERMMAKGYWSPRRNGLTPPATLYSGIIREIREKADNSRFRKVARGRFALNR